MTYVAQEGGDHYQSIYQHWDWVIDAEIGYLAGNATKYIARWRKKNGVDDLKKALSYVDKMILTRGVSEWHYRPSRWKTNALTERFIMTNDIPSQEANVIYLLSGPCHKEMLELARERLEALIRSAQSAAGAGQGGGGAGVAGQGATGAQSPLRGAPTAPDSRGVGGMAHPFGYDEESEG